MHVFDMFSDMFRAGLSRQQTQHEGNEECIPPRMYIICIISQRSLLSVHNYNMCVHVYSGVGLEPFEFSKSVPGAPNTGLENHII